MNEPWRGRDKVRNIPGIVQLNMKFERSFGLAKLGPREGGQAQADDRGIPGKKLVLESEFVLWCQGLATLNKFIKQAFEHFTRALSVGIG